MGLCCKCRIELRSTDIPWKPYCRGCYQRAFPFCDYCKNPLHKGQELIGNYHKFPCYSLETKKCCECFADVKHEHGDGIYCPKCYDVKNAPPLKMHFKYKDNEFSLHSRDDSVIDALNLFTDRLYNALQTSMTPRVVQEPTPQDNRQSSYWSYTRSWLEYPVKGVKNFVGRKILSLE